MNALFVRGSKEHRKASHNVEELIIGGACQLKIFKIDTKYRLEEIMAAGGGMKGGIL